MKIIINYIEDGQRRQKGLYVPTALLKFTKVLKNKLSSQTEASSGYQKSHDLSRGSEKFLGNLEHLNRSQMKTLIKELNRMRHKHPDVPLIVIEDNDGEGVTIFP